MVTVEAALGPGWGSKQVPGDDLPLDLGRPLEDPGCAHFPVEVFEQVPTLEGDRAVHLDRDVDHLLRGLGGKHLRHRGAARDMLVLAACATARSSAACAIPVTEARTLGRNKSSVRIASRKPPSPSPRTCSSGTNTPSSSSRPIGWADSKWRAVPLSPFASALTIKAVIPFV